jgi:hypothetical protein
MFFSCFFVLLAEGKDETVDLEVFNFTGAGGVALAMYNTDEVLLSFIWFPEIANNICILMYIPDIWLITVNSQFKVSLRLLWQLPMRRNGHCTLARKTQSLRNMMAGSSSVHLNYFLKFV